MRSTLVRCTLLAFAFPALGTADLAGQRAGGPDAALSAPPGADTDDSTYARAVALLDTVLVRPARADQVALLRPETHLLRRMLAAVAQDTRAPAYARGNALLLLGQNGGRRLDAFAVALEDTSTDVRAAATVGLGALLARANDPRIVELLRRALRDEERDVRARALEALADNAPDVLREFLETDPEEPLASIARTMLSLAQQRGAPSATGEAMFAEFAKPDESGARLVFRPLRTWPDAEAAQGELRLELPGGRAFALASGVEVVGGVIPAFVTPDGGAVVYEADRAIHVFDVATQESRTVGPGIAPRPYPLRSSLIYFRPREATRPGERGTAEVMYDVVEVPVEGSGMRVLGSVTASTDPTVRGGYSPVRWIRVRDVGGAFTLEGESVGVFRLPDPFDLPE